jgi:hypothetical protein
MMFTSANQRIVKLHASDASTSWWRRQVAYADKPEILFIDLLEFDKKIDAHFDGLIEAKQMGWNELVAQLKKSLVRKSADVSADCFALIQFTLQIEDEQAFYSAIELASLAKGFQDGLRGALLWNVSDFRSRMIINLLNHRILFVKLAAHQCLASHDLCSQIVWSDDHDELFHSADMANQSLLLKMLIDGRRFDCVDRLNSIADGVHSEPEFKYMMGRADMLLHKGRVKGEFLLDLIKAQPCPSLKPIRTLCALQSYDELKTSFSSLLQEPILREYFILACGWTGQARYVPWLIERMDDESVRPETLHAFRFITGFNLEQLISDFESPEESAESDWNFDIAEIKDWWMLNKSEFDEEIRYCYGQPMTTENLLNRLFYAPQIDREFVSEYLQIRTTKAGYIDISSGSFLQSHSIYRFEGKA